MKERPREESRFLTFFACLLLNAGLTLGSIFCPITAFRLPVDEVQLAVLLVLVCLLLSVLYRFRWAGLFLLGLWILTLAGAFLLAREELEQGARFLYTRLTTIYHTAYRSVQLPAWRPRTSGNVTLLLALWGGALACVNAWVIRRRQSVAPALLLDALPLALCLVVVDTPPDLWCLALLLAAVCLLLLTQSSRIRSPRGGSRLTLGLAPAGDGAPAGALPADSSRDLHKGPDRRGNPASYPGLGRGHAPPGAGQPRQAPAGCVRSRKHHSGRRPAHGPQAAQPSDHHGGSGGRNRLSVPPGLCLWLLHRHQLEPVAGGSLRRLPGAGGRAAGPNPTLWRTHEPSPSAAAPTCPRSTPPITSVNCRRWAFPGRIPGSRIGGGRRPTASPMELSSPISPAAKMPNRPPS